MKNKFVRYYLGSEGRKIGGLFTATGKLLKDLYNADDENYDNINYALGLLENEIKIPDLDYSNNKYNFAFNKSFVESKKIKNLLDDLNYYLNLVNYEIISEEFEIDKKDLVYKDNTQIAYKIENLPVNSSNLFLELLDITSIPKYLYHATYKPFYKSIMTKGLGNTNRKMWSDSKGKGTVYLSTEPEVAYSYAETSEWLDNVEDYDKYADNIIVLVIDTDKLDKRNLSVDENVILDNDVTPTYEYHGIIDSSAIVNIVDEQGNLIESLTSREVDSDTIIVEAKADIDRLIQWGGKDLADRFLAVKNRFKSPQNDLYYWIKNSTPEALATAISSLEDQITNSKKRQNIGKGVQLVGENDFWKVYHITTFDAAKYYGRDTKWCITGINGAGDYFWNDYTSNGIKFYFYITKNNYDSRGTNSKIALALYPEGFFEIFDQQDNKLATIPNAPKIDGIPAEVSLTDEQISAYKDLVYTGQKIETKYKSLIETVTVKEGVTEIIPDAFSDCWALKTVYIPDSLRVIGGAAFKGCSNLTEVRLSNNIIRLGSYAFAFCEKLKNISIPNKLSIIERATFYNCGFSEVRIPSGITEIHSSAFAGCEELRTVNIPEGLILISDRAFDHCPQLSKINLPNSLQILGADAFSDCISLSYIKIPKSVVSIGPGSFYNCSGLVTAGPVGSGSNIEFEWNEEIPSCAFYLTPNLYNIIIPEGITEIGAEAFDTTHIETVTIPKSVKVIRTKAFNACKYLKKVIFNNSNLQISRDAFDNCLNVTLYGLEASKVAEFAENNNIAFNAIKEHIEVGMYKLTLDESIFLETIASVMKNYPKIPEETFMQLIKLDPTYKENKDSVGKYGKWILNIYNKGNLKEEDFYKVPEYLSAFEEKKTAFDNKDIGQFKTLPELAKALDTVEAPELSHRQLVRQNQKARRTSDLSNEAKLVYETSDWEVWVPKTYAASCKLGAGTSWCTATTESDHYYNHYANMGPLYININKKDPEEKYQFHFESGQFMDRYDYSIDLAKFLNETPDLYDFYISLLRKSLGLAENQESVIINLDLAGFRSFLDVVENNDDNGTDLSAKTIYKIFTGDAYEYFLGNYQHSLDEVFSYVDDSDISDETRAYIANNFGIEDYSLEKDSAGEYDEYGDIETDAAINAIHTALRSATDRVWEMSSEAEAIADISKELVKSEYKAKIYPFDECILRFVIPAKEILDLYLDKYDEFDEADYGKTLLTTLAEAVYSKDIDIHEPYYGWSSFDTSLFDEEFSFRLSEELDNYKSALEKFKQ